MNDTDSNHLAGIINLFKPAGWSSAKYVYRLRTVLGIRKVGHAGTLDPFAEGVVLACLGRATKMVESLMSLGKCYRTTIRLGVTNATYDPEQPFEPVAGATPPEVGDLEEALEAFVGEIDQVPPAFSAVKIGGVPSYRFAQQGKPQPRQTKKVRVHSVRLLEYRWPLLRVDVDCGRGTYIRGIARDLGRQLGCGACCQALTRLAVGPFRMEESVNLDTADPLVVRAAVLSIGEAKRLLGESDVAARSLPGGEIP